MDKTHYIYCFLLTTIMILLCNPLYAEYISEERYDSLAMKFYEYEKWTVKR